MGVKGLRIHHYSDHQRGDCLIAMKVTVINWQGKIWDFENWLLNMVMPNIGSTVLMKKKEL